MEISIEFGRMLVMHVFGKPFKRRMSRSKNRSDTSAGGIVVDATANEKKYWSDESEVGTFHMVQEKECG